jgi:hypothetical protein
MHSNWVPLYRGENTDRLPTRFDESGRRTKAIKGGLDVADLENTDPAIIAVQPSRFASDSSFRRRAVKPEAFIRPTRETR